MTMIYNYSFARLNKKIWGCLTGLLLLLSNTLIAQELNFQLDLLSKLGHGESSNSYWQQVIINPNNQQQYFVVNRSGQLYLLEDSIVETKLLDLTRSIPLEEQSHGKQSLKFTAMALHPNFSLRDQEGYGTFYTAHVEPINKTSNTKRLQERSANIPLEFDAVITEWKFSAINHKKVDLSTKREILRIAVPDFSFGIEQLSFNPRIKSWNENFGLLFISLGGDKKWQQPLYSGVVLRINPAKFGLRSYTVPKLNPFLKDSKVKDEIYVVGAQHIQQFLWPDKNSEHLLLIHKYNENHLLSLTTGRDDWRTNLPKKMIYQSYTKIQNVIVYRGRNLVNLRNTLLLLTQDKQNWSIKSLSFKYSLAHQKDTPSPTLLWQFTHQQLAQSTDIALSSNPSGEMLLLDNSNALLYQLSPEQTGGIYTQNEQSKPDEEDDSNLFSVFFILCVIAGGIYYFVTKKPISAKILVRQQYGKIKLSDSKQQISLFQRHQNHAEVYINLLDITCCAVQLNEHEIGLISKEENQGFSNEKESDLRAIFTREHIDKMVDGKLRQVSLVLTDNQKDSYNVCLYMRKGSDRITKVSYFDVVDDVIDWCWLIAQNINPDGTHDRKAKSTEAKKEQSNTIYNKDLPLHNQAAEIRPATHKSSANRTSKPSSVTSKANSKRIDDSPQVDMVAPKSEVIKNTEQPTNSTIDTELVNALEKLVNLKQQGFLTTAEFAQAKEKLLKNLFDK